MAFTFSSILLNSNSKHQLFNEFCYKCDNTNGRNSIFTYTHLLYSSLKINSSTEIKLYYHTN